MNSNDENSTVEPADDQLAKLPAEKLAQMLREKRRSEGNYRAKLREVEGERDRLSEAVTGYQRSTFAEFARDRKVLDSAVADVAQQVSIAALMRPDGTLDEELAAKELAKVQEAKPYMFEQAAARSSADFTGSSGSESAPSVGWGDVLGS